MQSMTVKSPKNAHEISKECQQNVIVVSSFGTAGPVNYERADKLHNDKWEIHGKP